MLVKPELFCDSRKEGYQSREFKLKSGKIIFFIIQRHLCSFGCLSGTGCFSVCLLQRGKDKATFSDSPLKQCEKRSAEFADTHI